jgi:hypothetical protein
MYITTLYINSIFNILIEQYNIYLEELYKIKANHIKFILENRITYKNTNQDMLNKVIYDHKLTKFVDLSKE